MNEEGLNKIETSNKSFVSTKKFFESQEEMAGMVVLYNDAPAINENLGGIIKEINGIKITSIGVLTEELQKYNPGDKINIKSIKEEGVSEDEVVLVENPNYGGKAFLGIGFYQDNNKNIVAKGYKLISGFKKPKVYYEPNFELSVFFYDLFWWIIIINLLVALFNMLPFGFLDGGRFFYLTVLGITKSKKIAEKTFSAITYFLFLLLIVLIIKWIWGFF